MCGLAYVSAITTLAKHSNDLYSQPCTCGLGDCKSPEVPILSGGHALGFLLVKGFNRFHDSMTLQGSN